MTISAAIFHGLREPDDDAPAELLRFEHRADGGSLAYLGRILIGWVSDAPAYGSPAWLCWLPGPLGPDLRPRRAATLAKAREGLTFHVQAWIEAGGLAFPDNVRPITGWRG